LIARQAEAFSVDEQNEKRFGETCERVPDDLINFLHDPFACAIAMGYQEGVEIQEVPLRLDERNGFLVEEVDPKGNTFPVVVRIDGSRFNQFWLDKIVNR